MTKIKKIISFVTSIAVILFILINYNKIQSKFSEYINNLKEDRTVKILPGNEYTRNYEYKYLSNSKDYVPYSNEDLINIVYGVLNQGWDEFTFYCPRKYEDCIEDVRKLSNNDEYLSHINNYVNPYNSYSSLKTIYDDTGMVTLEVNHLYTKEEIEKDNKVIDEIIKNNIKEGMTDTEKIRVIHDYIINNTKYDTKRAEKKDSPYDSARIQGLLFEHFATCSGYSDTMAVILDKLNIPNYKVSSDNHVWNAVYIDGKWKHLDLTWDDPVNSTGPDTLEYNYFLIDTDKLLDIDKKDQHVFNQDVYLEFKKEA